jgi:hypothetical protein
MEEAEVATATYEAISYVWGKEDNPASIICNDL